MNTEGEKRRTLGWGIAAVLLFVGVIHAAWLILGDTIVVGGGLADGDGFTHLIRAERLWHLGAWFDVSIPDANAPFGTTVHWTRLFDIVLLGLAAPMIPFLGVAKGVYWAGVVISPLLHLALAAAMVWTVRPLIGGASALLAGGLTATQFGILAFAIAGRADHHMMFALFVILTLGCLARALEAVPANQILARWAGLWIAAGIWTGPEFLLFLSLCLAGLGWTWLIGRQGALKANLGLAEGLAAGLIAVVLIERGPTVFAETEFDRLSITHATIGILLWLFWRAAFAVQRWGRMPESIPWRIGIAAAGAAGSVFVMWFLFPDAIANPLTQGNPEIVPIFAHISEYGGVRDLAGFLIYFGSVLFAIPWMIWRFRSRMNTTLAGIWMIVSIGLLTYVAFGVGWIRWSLYAALFLTIVLADFIGHIDGTIDKKMTFPARVPVKVLVLAAIIIGPVGVAGVLRYVEKTPEERLEAAIDPCPLKPMADFLNNPPWSEKSRVIVASANFGPELIYRTPHRAVATVHHRNIAGILDGHRILGGADDEKIRTIVDNRTVNLLLLCPGSKNDGYFVTEGDKNSLYERLTQGVVPSWLSAVGLPAKLNEKFRLFEVHSRR